MRENTARTYIPYYIQVYEKLRTVFHPRLSRPYLHRKYVFACVYVRITVYYDYVYMCEYSREILLMISLIYTIHAENTCTHRTQKYIAGLPLSRLMIHCRECTL